MQIERANGRVAGDPLGGGMAGVVARNIHALLALREQEERSRKLGARIADTVTGFAGSMAFVCLHAALFGGWIIVNLGWIPGFKPFDPFPFVMLAMAASVEAIFLSTFILISQNRMAALDQKRADLDLQVNLLAEHEVTRLIHMVEAIAEKVGVSQPEDGELEELKNDVHPEVVLKEIEEAEMRWEQGSEAAR